MREFFDKNWRKHNCRRKKIILIMIVVVGGLSFIGYSDLKKSADAKHTRTIYDSWSVEELEQMKLHVRDSLLFAVDTYIKNVNSTPSLSTSLIVDESLKSDMDLTLLLAQAHLESQCGRLTGGTSSVYGIAKRYSSQDESTVDYIKLMKKRYLTGDRAVEHLIASGFTASKTSKYKYAEDPEYSMKVDSIRKKIITTTGIYKLQERWAACDEAIKAKKLD